MSSTDQHRYYNGDFTVDTETGRISPKPIDKNIMFYGIVRDLVYNSAIDKLEFIWSPLSERLEMDKTEAQAVVLPYGKLVSDTGKFGSLNLNFLRPIILNSVKIFYKYPDGSDPTNYDPITGWVTYINLPAQVTRRYFFP